MIRMNVIQMAIPVLFQGFQLTVIVSLLSLIFGVVVGLLLSLVRLTGFLPFRAFERTFIEIFRNIPFMVQLYIIYYALPNIGIRLPPLQAGVIALSLYTGAYVAIIFDMGIEAIPQGQWEAAASLRLTRWQTIQRIILPQTLPIILPTMVNQCVTTVKDSSVLSVITVGELTMEANHLMGQTFAPFSVFIVASLFYWALNVVIEFVGRRLEHGSVRHQQVFRI